MNGFVLTTQIMKNKIIVSTEPLFATATAQTTLNFVYDFLYILLHLYKCIHTGLTLHIFFYKILYQYSVTQGYI